jgi:Flp pilus assembly protein protease CpaA
MEFVKKAVLRLPGCGASGLMIFFTVFWTYWGIAEMYHEGWWGAWYNRLPYLAPIALTLLPTLVSFRWPIVGGGLIILVGAFALFFFDNDVAFIGLAIALVGIAFLVDGIVRRRAGAQETTSPAPWWRHYWRYLLAIGAPLIVFIGISAYMLPIVLTRVDDGDRSARLVQGNGVALVWAPEGPGWNWKQSWGGYPSWQSIALYGVPPLGLGDKPGYGRQGQGHEKVVFATGQDMLQTNLCRYLSADGSALLDEPQDIWRMPTTDEVVRSLGRHGANAGCAWQGKFRQRVKCDVLPDKESPLWSTAQPAIYYWTADSYNESLGYFVAYNGTVNATYKLGGNPRHGYRCVKGP